MTDRSEPDDRALAQLFIPDPDLTETREWLDAVESLIQHAGAKRAVYVLSKLIDHARYLKLQLPAALNTPYVNTVAVADEPPFPGALHIEARISAIIRWNALAMVVGANRTHPELGGHVATYASSADLFDVGYNHFFHGGQNGDAVYFQPHSSPGVYARAYVEGRLTEQQLTNYRREAGGSGLSSYCHPWLMPDFWQFPTGSMGLGPLNAVYQARFMRYLAARAITETRDRKVWCFVGDGEMDEPESLAGLTLASRERLDNLIFVVNCNLQRLDGPVRGNGSIIQELEGLFAGAGWNVVKLLWGSDWDPLFARDHENIILRRLHETVDGEFQKYAATDGRFNREHFFAKYPELQVLVAHLSDDDIDRLRRGGHDPVKIHAAYRAAVNHKGRPSVVLAQTKKGYGMGTWGQGKMTAHQAKKLEDDALLAFRDRFELPLPDEDVRALRLYKPAGGSLEMQYLRARREALGGYVPARATRAISLPAPGPSLFAKQLEGSGDREQSTTMVFVNMLSALLRDKSMGRHIVPIVADEARTFGMQSLFRQIAIYSPNGQLYEPEDKDELLYYKESKDGQILEEGITEAGAISSWLAAATSYSVHGVPMLPFYIFYSCFGFQRIGDLVWASADSRARGFLLGATAGRTTLSGEGLQHEDGSSHLLFSTVPNCVAYDPAFGYELATIIRDGIRRMHDMQEDVFYYVTVMNETYVQPKMPQGVEEGIVRGMYRLREADRKTVVARVTLLGSGTLLREVIAAAEMLRTDFGIGADVWSVTSFTELRRDGLGVERYNRLHPVQPRRQSWVEACLHDTQGPVIAVTDYMRTVPDLIRAWIPGEYVVLGTDGFGRSDTRVALRDFFEVDRKHIAIAALSALAGKGTIDVRTVSAAIVKYDVATDRRNPWDV